MKGVVNQLYIIEIQWHLINFKNTTTFSINLTFIFNLIMIPHRWKDKSCKISNKINVKAKSGYLLGHESQFSDSCFVLSFVLIQTLQVDTHALLRFLDFKDQLKDKKFKTIKKNWDFSSTKHGYELEGTA